MCGRYSFVPTQKQLDAAFRDVVGIAQLKVRFNIAPTETAPVLANDQPSILQMMNWGLLPAWSRDGALSGERINARAEGIAEKPSFREPIRTRHCLVPADSFYEWRTLPGKRKVPYRILLKDGELMMMAGVWDEWKKGGETKRTFSIITTTPNREIAALHNRMPVILTTPEAQQKWLSDLSMDETLALLKPPPDGVLRLYRVSEKLNKAGYDGEDLHREVPEEPELF
jgi:putative SOS response-associated peptidase YedK